MFGLFKSFEFYIALRNRRSNCTKMVQGRVIYSYRYTLKSPIFSLAQDKVVIHQNLACIFCCGIQVSYLKLLLKYQQIIFIFYA